uniref:Uncharacterized protein n=1 Tax=Lotus japonicus TaxID=34305 RepID=I3T7D5_LOTJA|nr:unknown [Lotus japonicus]
MHLTNCHSRRIENSSRYTYAAEVKAHQTAIKNPVLYSHKLQTSP